MIALNGAGGGIGLTVADVPRDRQAPVVAARNAGPMVPGAMDRLKGRGAGARPGVAQIGAETVGLDVPALKRAGMRRHRPCRIFKSASFRTKKASNPSPGRSS
jgi:hypothetical protein